MRCPSRDLHICGFGVAAHLNSLLSFQLPLNNPFTIVNIVRVLKPDQRTLPYTAFLYNGTLPGPTDGLEYGTEYGPQTSGLIL